VAENFQFHTGEVFPALRLGYVTLGTPGAPPVLVLHGTGGSGSGLLANEMFSRELFGPGMVLDAARHYVILPDALGAGRSSKPSDGMRARFPRYNYDDMVSAQYRLVTEGLGVRHLRLVMGNSMGGMHAWLWGAAHPRCMDALVPMAATPAAMSGRNWMMRRLLIDTIRRDPEWMGGDYTTQPRSLQFASVFFSVGTNGGDQGLQRRAPTRRQADMVLDDCLAAECVADANDTLYQWEAAGDYDPAPRLEHITARVLAINSGDDERNPPSLGLTEAALVRIRGARLYLIPAGPLTSGHGTTAQARWWKDQLAQFLDDSNDYNNKNTYNIKGYHRPALSPRIAITIIVIISSIITRLLLQYYLSNP
jgi:homoserine O-acetyltransferase